MDVADDLTAEALTEALPGRPIRTYPALVSTESDAQAWARSGATEGSLVVADYQVAARGWAGWEWEVHPGQDVGFSLVLPSVVAARPEGWLYMATALGVTDAIGDATDVWWPDAVNRDGKRIGSVAVHAEAAPGSAWAVVSVLLAGAPQPRTQLLARTVEAIEDRSRSPEDRLADDYLPRCRTIGTAVRAHLVPLGPAGERVEGTAASVRADGALVVRTPEDRHAVISPESAGKLEHLSTD